MGRLLIRGEHGHDIIDELAPDRRARSSSTRPATAPSAAPTWRRILRGARHRHAGVRRRHRRRLRPHDAARGLRPLVRLPLRRGRDLLLRSGDPAGLREDDRGGGRHLGRAHQRRRDGSARWEVRRRREAGAPPSIGQPPATRRAPVPDVVVRPQLARRSPAASALRRRMLASARSSRSRQGSRARSRRRGSRCRSAASPARITGGPEAARRPAIGDPPCAPGCSRSAGRRTAPARRGRDASGDLPRSLEAKYAPSPLSRAASHSSAWQWISAPVKSASPPA